MKHLKQIALVTVWTLLWFGAAARWCGASVYDVGPGKPAASLNDVPLAKLQPGDTVNLYWRAQAYPEKVLLSVRGEAGKPITLHGVPGPAGQLPALDGANAVTGKDGQTAYDGTQTRGLLTVAQRPGQAWGYKPGFLVVENIALKGASYPGSFTNAKGVRAAYTYNAAGFFVERGENITLRNVQISECGNGLFVASGGSEEVVSGDIRVENCRIFGNGNVGRDREHNVYTEAAGVAFVGCYIGWERPGAMGSALKDRSAGTVIKNCWIEGGARSLDLVEPQEGWPILSKDPRGLGVLVEGCTLLVGPGAGVRPVHFGGDQGNDAHNRKSVLRWENNTVIVLRNQSETWRVSLFDLTTNDERLEVKGGRIIGGAASPGSKPAELSLLNTAGTATFDGCAIDPIFTPFRKDAPITGTASVVALGVAR